MRYAPKLIAPAAAMIAATACLYVPPAADSKEIRERYPHRVQERCHSWLHSASTGFEYCASPPFKATPPVDLVAVAASTPKQVTDGPVELGALQGTGKDVYGRICSACHQADGKGLPGSFPPLAGSGEFYGDAQNMARIIVHGLTGEITVQGQTYNGAMPGQGAVLSDYEVAAVATYVRTSFGNDDGMVTPDDVKAVR